MHEANANVLGAERVSAMLTSTGRERDVACWRVCDEVAKDLASFSPRANIYPPDGWRIEEQASIDLLRGMPFDDVPNAARMLGRTFGAYRDAVLNLEGDNAKKLQTLLWSVEQIMNFARREGADEIRLGALVEGLGNHLSHVWKVRSSPKDIRMFSLRHCRRYDLLPREWREL